ncbi:hypothetical protein Dimus_024813 [Dionaea muscipula]
MSSVQHTVHYCCVARGGRILYAYNGVGVGVGVGVGSDHEMENLAALCIERAPLYHMWYFQTMGRRTFGFLMEDGCVYFAIADHGLGNHGLLLFLERVRDDFKRVSSTSRRGLKGSLSSLNSGCLQEQLLPVVRQLIHSLEHVSHPAGVDNWNAAVSPSPGDSTEYIMEGAASTKAPLLEKAGKPDRKAKDHVTSVREMDEFEEQRKSTDRGFRSDLSDPKNQGVAVSSMSLQRETSGSSMRRSASQSIRRKWCRHVRVVIAIDVAVCLVLFIVWLAICHGFECLR